MEDPRVALAASPKPRPDHYRVVCISLYREDLDRVDRLVRELKAKGQRRANRSSVIRQALRQVEETLHGGT
jgi:metal-responsive CopG/Arc/MetJ family transcriptional regulator